MSCPTLERRGERGLTLVEIAISMVLLTALMLALGKVLDAGMGSYQSTSPAVTGQLAHRSVEKVVGHLSAAGIETVQVGPMPTPDGSILTFANCLGSVAGEKVWGPSNYLEWREDPEDPTDGTDNDGDGIVDEGMVVLRMDVGLPSQTTTVLARGVARHLAGEKTNGIDDNGNGHVDEKGLLVEIRERALRIHLTLVRQGKDGRPIERTARAVVAMRN